MSANKIIAELKALSDREKAKLLGRYFKTGRGHYGYGDIFIGVMVPLQKKIAAKYSHLSLDEIKKLLQSKVHEHRFTALQILVRKFQGASAEERKKIHNFYLKNAKRINNWDLVDSSARQIVGDYLSATKDYKILSKLSGSKNLWERRIAIIATHAFIAKSDFNQAKKIAEKYLKDAHDLIHKATGWTLRELGKKSETELRRFLNKKATKMPRTMLRYAIERLPRTQRIKYLHVKKN